MAKKKSKILWQIIFDALFNIGIFSVEFDNYVDLGSL